MKKRKENRYSEKYHFYSHNKRRIKHYDNTPMQYTAIFNGCKNDNFQMKNCDIFLLFAQNIDFG